MKNKLLSFLGLFSLIAIFMIGCSKVKADTNYDITNMDVTAKVKLDGSVMIHRKIFYDFDSSMHGVYYRQNLTDKQKISDIQIKVNNKAIVPATNEKNDTYQLTKEKNSYHFKVFHKIKENDQIKVEYSYKISNLITNYKDTAELNFKIIGNDWDTDINHAKVTVIFPKAVEGLKAWAHGSADGEIQVLPEKGKIVMKDNDVAGDVGIEVHAIFPTAVTIANKNYIAKNMKTAIEKQEAKLAIEANEKRKRKIYFAWGLIVLSLISGIIVIIKGLFGKSLGFKPKSLRSISHNYEIPTVDPITAQIIDTSNLPSAKAFTGYLMQLAAKKQINIQEIKGKHLHKVNYKISILDKSILNDELLAFLFKQVGDGQAFTTKDLRQYISNKLGKTFDRWCKNKYKEIEKAGLLNPAFAEAKSHYHLTSIIAITISIASWIIAGIQMYIVAFIGVGILLTILEFAAFFIGSRKISLYTKKGAELADQVHGFKKMLADIGNFKMKDVGDLILWEDIMPYAVAFGLSQKVLKQLKLEFNQTELENAGLVMGSYFYTAGNNSFERNFSSSFSQGISYGISSTVGASGSFSGGSSGGIGGGSGGGAF